MRVGEHEEGRRQHGELEGQVLTVLWSADRPLTGAEVHEGLGAPELSYKTVLTVLTRLLSKGRVARQKAGRAFVFQPVPDGSAAAAERMARVLARGADRAAVLQGFVDALDPADEAMLRTLLEDRQERRP